MDVRTKNLEKQNNCRIVEEQKNYYIIDTSAGLVRATPRGVLKKGSQRICVGDLVDIVITNREPLEGLVTKIHKRHQFLKRPPIANVSRVFFINSICEPPLDFEAIDRFLFSAEVHKLTSVLLFNKVDILDKQGWEQLEKTMEIYHRIGYQTLPVSVHEGTGIDSVIDLTKDTISTLAGLSGVGKSSLLAKIFPDKDFRIGSLSESTGKGMHTTTHITLHRLGNGGYIADTPGFAFVRLPFIDEDDVVVCFPEIAAQAGNCRFNNCIHENEPGCRVREMVEMGEIAESRWQHYLKIYKEMREWRQQYR